MSHCSSLPAWFVSMPRHYCSIRSDTAFQYFVPTDNLATLAVKELLDAGSYAAARDKGLIRIEGKEYVVQDGDVVLFRFNV